MYLFELVSRHMTWLAERQSVTASNIANADTPGYRARSVTDFPAVLDGAAIPLAATSPMHLSLDTIHVSTSGLRMGASWGSAHSGNNVTLEAELMTASSNTRMMSLDAILTRSFHRMLLSSVKV